jgi:adenylate cyclase
VIVSLGIDLGQSRDYSAIATVADDGDVWHIWADRFDGELADVFELQDQVTASVVAAIEPSLRQAEIDRARRKPTERLDAYDFYLRALPHSYALTREGIDKAIELLDEALAIDPRFALAKALAARCYAWRNPQGWAAAPEEEKATAVRLGREALQDGAEDATVLWMVGFVMWQLRVDPEGPSNCTTGRSPSTPTARRR